MRRLISMTVFLSATFYMNLLKPFTSTFCIPDKPIPQWVSTYPSPHDSMFNLVYKEAIVLTGDTSLSKELAAQSMIESRWGKSRLAKEDNNWFGVKASKSQEGRIWVTYEFIGGHLIKVNAKFRTYKSLSHSITSRLSFRKKGYATDPSYWEKVNIVVKRYSRSYH
jgi:hypothetical protein